MTDRLSAYLLVGLIAFTLSCSGLSPGGQNLVEGPPVDLEEGPFAQNRIIDFLFKLQGAAESGRPDLLEKYLESDTFRRLRDHGPPLEETMASLRLITHPARFHRSFQLGTYREIEGEYCYKIILPEEGRYRFLDGPIPEPYRFKEITFWTCLSEQEGQLKAKFAYPLNALVCLTQ